MTYRAKLVIPAEEASRIDYLLSQMDGKMQSAVCKASYEVPFPNGYKAKVDLMVDFFSWAEGCLCNEKGETVCKTQSQNFLFDSWVFILDGACYMIDVTREVTWGRIWTTWGEPSVRLFAVWTLNSMFSVIQTSRRLFLLLQGCSRTIISQSACRRKSGIRIRTPVFPRGWRRCSRMTA